MHHAARVAEAFQSTREVLRRVWRWSMWYLVASSPIPGLGGTWVMRYVLAVGRIVFSACMLAGGICGLRWRPQS